MTHRDDLDIAGTADGPDLAALLGSKICHDLASPLGGLSNGVEILEALTEGPSDELSLIRFSIDAALARLKFFRLAFGGGGEDGAVGAAEAAGIVAAMYRDSRRTIAWEDRSDRPRSEMRMAFLALACIETVTPWSAAVTVRCDGGAWRIGVAAERLKPSERWDALAAGRVPDDLRGDEVQFGLLARAAARAGRAIRVAASDTSVDLTI